VSSDAVLLKIDRFGQLFERRAAVQGAVRAVLIVMGLVLAQDPVPLEYSTGDLSAPSPVGFQNLATGVDLVF
jgi:hypothetical protein